MYFRASVDDTKKNIIIETDDVTVRGLLEYVIEERTWAPWLKQWIDGKKKKKIYDKSLVDKQTGHEFFQIGIGWASYVIMMFQRQMLKQDYDDIVGGIYRDTYRTQPFPELRDVQNQDVLHILKYRRGLASIYTGYGELISN